MTIAATGERGERRDARRHRLAVGEHRARAALFEPAAELGGAQSEVVAQHVEERRVGVRLDDDAAPVDVNFELV